MELLASDFIDENLHTNEGAIIALDYFNTFAFKAANLNSLIAFNKN